MKNAPPLERPRVRAGYDRWAPLYDADDNPMVTLEQPALHAAVGHCAGLQVADLGCGTGRHTLWLAQQGARVIGLDFSEGMLTEARSKAASQGLTVDLRLHDLTTPLPLPSASQDLIVSGLVLEHLPELGPFFAEVHRILRPGGRAVLTAMHPALFLAGTQARFTDPATGERVAPGSLPHSIGAFVMAAVRAGLELLDITEQSVDEALVRQHPRVERYLGWPMLVVLVLRRPVAGSGGE